MFRCYDVDREETQMQSSPDTERSSSTGCSFWSSLWWPLQKNILIFLGMLLTWKVKYILLNSQGPGKMSVCCQIHPWTTVNMNSLHAVYSAPGACMWPTFLSTYTLSGFPCTNNCFSGDTRLYSCFFSYMPLPSLLSHLSQRMHYR